MAYNTIYVRQGQSQRVQLERVPAAAFYPGHLIELTSANKFQKHSAAGGVVAPCIFAMEDENQGKEIGDVFGTTSPAIGIIPQKGDFVYAVLQNGQTIVIGDELESAGDGTLRKRASGIGIATALEALDLAGSSGAETPDASLGYNKRLLVMIG